MVLAIEPMLSSQSTVPPRIGKTRSKLTRRFAQRGLFIHWTRRERPVPSNKRLHTSTYSSKTHVLVRISVGYLHTLSIEGAVPYVHAFGSVRCLVRQPLA